MGNPGGISTLSSRQGPSRIAISRMQNATKDLDTSYGRYSRNQGPGTNQHRDQGSGLGQCHYQGPGQERERYSRGQGPGASATTRHEGLPTGEVRTGASNERTMGLCCQIETKILPDDGESLGQRTPCSGANRQVTALPEPVSQ